MILDMYVGLQGVQNLAHSILKDPIRITIGRRGGATETVKQSLLYVGQVQ